MKPALRDRRIADVWNPAQILAALGGADPVWLAKLEKNEGYRRLVAESWPADRLQAICLACGPGLEAIRTLTVERQRLKRAADALVAAAVALREVAEIATPMIGVGQAGLYSVDALGREFIERLMSDNARAAGRMLSDARKLAEAAPNGGGRLRDYPANNLIRGLLETPRYTGRALHEYCHLLYIFVTGSHIDFKSYMRRVRRLTR